MSASTGPALAATVAGIGFWADGVPSWDDARAFAAGGALPEGAPKRPSPGLLAPNERRRAPGTVAVALEVAQAACAAAGRDPATLPSVFASTHGDLAITDYMCATLADAPAEISPTRFHNSVHNAAAGYWTIGTGCLRPATAVSAPSQPAISDRSAPREVGSWPVSTTSGMPVGSRGSGKRAGIGSAFWGLFGGLLTLAVLRPPLDRSWRAYYGAVLAREMEGGDRRLVAYWVPAEGAGWPYWNNCHSRTESTTSSFFFMYEA